MTTTTDLAKKLTLAEAIKTKWWFPNGHPKQLSVHVKDLLIVLDAEEAQKKAVNKELDQIYRRLVDIEAQIKTRRAMDMMQRKEWAKRLLTEVEGRLATLQVKRGGSNSNELSLERALAELQKIRAELEAEERVKE